MSITLIGLLVSVGGTLLLKLGFSEVCSNEIVSNIPLVIGGVLAWYGRWRVGGVTPFGTRKV